MRATAQVGAVRPTPSPSSKVAGEMLNIFAIFGGGDQKLRDLIQEMQEVQEHNEQVIEQAQAARTEAIAQQRKAVTLFDEAKQIKGEADTAKEAFEHTTKQVTSNLEEKHRVLATRERNLAREAVAHEARVKRDDEHATSIRLNLDKRQGYVQGAEARMASKTEDFRKHIASIQDAHSRMSGLQTAVNGLHEWIESSK